MKKNKENIKKVFFLYKKFVKYPYFAKFTKDFWITLRIWRLSNNSMYDERTLFINGHWFRYRISSFYRFIQKNGVEGLIFLDRYMTKNKLNTCVIFCNNKIAFNYFISSSEAESFKKLFETNRTKVFRKN